MVVWKHRDKAVSSHIKLFKSNKPDTAGATVVKTGRFIKHRRGEGGDTQCWMHAFKIS